MKTTVYRTSGDSPLVPALVECAEAGKQSVCLVELKARFDEHRNIEWSRALERAGVHVVYGFPNLKIHAKMTLIVRPEEGVLRRYVHLGTGNYHSLTARIYEDLGLFTADEDIAADVADLFNHITGFGRPQRFRKLLVAPFGLREGLIDEIQVVTAAAKAGKTARIRFKVNALTDPKIIQALYAASQAGRRDRHLRSRHLLALAGARRHQRDDPRAEHARPVPRAQPRVRVPGRQALRLLPRQRRPHAAEPRQPPGDPRAGREHAHPAASLRRFRRSTAGQLPGVGSPSGRNLAALATEEGRDEARDARGADAQGGAPQPSFHPAP